MFLGKEMICFYIGDIAIGEGISWDDLLLLWISKQEARVKIQDFVWEKIIFF